MKKNMEELQDIIENMKEQLGPESLLDELLSALNVDELNENLEYIDRTHDLDNF